MSWSHGGGCDALPGRLSQVHTNYVKTGWSCRWILGCSAQTEDTTHDNPVLSSPLYRTPSKVGSTRIEYWGGDPYPDFVAEGTGDQHAINAAICAVKKATYDGVDCVGGDDAATGTVNSIPCGFLWEPLASFVRSSFTARSRDQGRRLELRNRSAASGGRIGIGTTKQ